MVLKISPSAISTMRLSCRFATAGMIADFFGDAVAVTESAVAGRAINVETFASPLEQFAVSTRQRIGRHKIRRAGDAAGVDRSIFKRINRAVHSLHRPRCAPRFRGRQLRTDAVREKVKRLFRAQFQLAVHVREKFERRLARQSAGKTDDADTSPRRAPRRINMMEIEVAHQSLSSTISMCAPPMVPRAACGFRSRKISGRPHRWPGRIYRAKRERNAALQTADDAVPRQLVERDHADERAHRGGQHEQNIRRHDRHRHAEHRLAADEDRIIKIVHEPDHPHRADERARAEHERKRADLRIFQAHHFVQAVNRKRRETRPSVNSRRRAPFPPHVKTAAGESNSAMRP